MTDVIPSPDETLASEPHDITLGIGDVAFADRVNLELQLARQEFPPLMTHEDAAGVIREEFDEYWDQVKLHQARRDPCRLLKELVQVAAMCRRAAEDLGLMDLCGLGTLLFEEWRADSIETIDLRRPRLTSSHAAAERLRSALDRYFEGVRIGLAARSPMLLLQALADSATICQRAANNLRLPQRAEKRASEQGSEDQGIQGSKGAAAQPLQSSDPGILESAGSNS